MKVIRIALACALAVLACDSLAAESVLKPLPTPDLSRVSKAKADELLEIREEFDKLKPGLVGPPLAQAYALVGSSYALAGFYDVAEVAFYDATVVSPDDGRWVYLQGVLAKPRNPAAAREFFERALQLDSRYLPIRAAVVEQRLSAGDLDGARRAIDSAGAEFKDSAKLAALRADVAYRQKRYADALTALNDALRLEPTANQLYALQADIYAAQGNAAAATAARAKAGTTPVSMEDTLAAGVVGMSSAAPVAAPVAAAAPAADKDDPLTQARFLLGVHQYVAARDQLELALRQQAGNPAALGMLARVEAMLGNRSAAASRAGEAVKATPDNALAYVTRAVVAETAGDEAAAQADYEKAIGLDADLAEARLLLGNRLMRAGRYGQAAEQYRQLIKLEPARSEHYGRLVAAQVAEGRCAQALKDIDAGLRDNQRQGYLVQLFVRLASTCKGASDTERSMALDYAQRLYQQRKAPLATEAYALASAAAGKFEQALELQGAAIFAAARDGGADAAQPFREFFKLFESKQVPDKPWASDNPYFKPARLQPLPPEATKPAA